MHLGFMMQNDLTGTGCYVCKMKDCISGMVLCDRHLEGRHGLTSGCPFGCRHDLGYRSLCVSRGTHKRKICGCRMSLSSWGLGHKTTWCDSVCGYRKDLTQQQPLGAGMALCYFGCGFRDGLV